MILTRFFALGVLAISVISMTSSTANAVIVGVFEVTQSNHAWITFGKLPDGDIMFTFHLDNNTTYEKFGFSPGMEAVFDSSGTTVRLDEYGHPMVIFTVVSMGANQESVKMVDKKRNRTFQYAMLINTLNTLEQKGRLVDQTGKTYTADQIKGVDLIYGRPHFPDVNEGDITSTSVLFSDLPVTNKFYYFKIVVQ